MRSGTPRARAGPSRSWPWISIGSRSSTTFGHALGDRLIATVAGRLQNAVRAIDTVARVGGDEFAIVQVDVKEPNGARRLARRLIEALSQPFDLDGQEVAVSVSVPALSAARLQ